MELEKERTIDAHRITSIVLSLSSSRVRYPPDTTSPSQQVALSDRMDEWITGQNVLLKVARDNKSKNT